MDMKILVPLLQTVDSAFPTGGFSHSLGLEAFIQHTGTWRCAKNLGILKHAFVCILENSGSLSLPFVRAAHSAIVNRNVIKSEQTEHHTLVQLDKICEAYTTNHIARRASTRQGKSFLEVACFTYSYLAQQLSSAIVDLPHCHLPVVYGAILAGLGVDENTTLATFMYCVVRSMIATAVRLDVLGAMEGQKVQFNLQQLIPEILDRNRTRSVENACMKFPVIDVLQNTQDTLFSKLFYS
ncbi:unnamed protein product [Candidula unifasciata]|uniref:Urease accessory protein UreF n=1 Tax=Candidula unifasciata TaxID=100452 RepID=A0A8S3ZJ57_9EUPU|nr:unnamed protein product [Candidula unifasciata]